jgi:hypothetical protein
MDWRCNPSDRVPVLQAYSPELKDQSHQTKKINKRIEVGIFL